MNDIEMRTIHVHFTMCVENDRGKVRVYCPELPMIEAKGATKGEAVCNFDLAACVYINSFLKGDNDKKISEE